MKLQSIYTFFAIFITNTNAGKLSPEENEARLEKCGTALDWGTFGYGSIGSSLRTTATLISSRHVIMSADIVLKSDMTYYHNGQRFDNSKCEGGEHVHIKVDKAIYPSISLSWKFTDFSSRSKKEQRVEVIDAHIICSNDTFKVGGHFFFPMVVEISPRIEMKLPCLWDSNEDPLHWRDNENLYVYHYSPSANPNPFQRDTVHFVNARIKLWLFFTTNHFRNSTQRGAAIFKYGDKKKWVLVGIGAGAYNQEPWFYNARWFETDVCKLTGVCRTLKAPETATTEEPSTAKPTTEEPTTEELTTEAPTTKEPVTEEPTTEEPKAVEIPTNEPPTEEPVTKDPIASPEPVSIATSEIPELSTPVKSGTPEPMEPIKTIDLDEEYKEFKEREDNEEEDWDEWGNDFYRSADFFESSGRRTELFVDFLMVTMVMVWRIVLG